ncbi:uncharacterized protein RAG0_16274 [Rhynchosporium agropyri]|uniref:Uncharacterized protein n=1 Tax=Rhynchosporium agropyri TaxID=914238 RepID=A0A1E1LPN5_9HELO|nr:uncharacterized protein RAG0_16274 [Rhynchosporium agropyri]
MNPVYRGREDSIADTTIASETLIQRDIISGVEVYTQDIEGEDDFDDFVWR